MSKRRWAWPLVFALAACTHAPEKSPPRESEKDEVRLDLTTGPKPIGWTGTGWPLKEQFKGHEGWVDLHFMVDTAGKTYEVAVTDSTGNERFETAAILATQKWSFEPAMFEGKPTEAGYHLRLYFTHWYARDLRLQFATTYNEAVAAINAGDRQRAEAALRNLTVDNLREDTFVGLAKYQFEAKWGTEAGQISALRRAVAAEFRPRIAQWPRLGPALQTLVRLELRTKDFASAMQTWNRLKKLKPERASLAQLQPIIDDALALRNDDRTYAVPGEIAADSSSWFYSLYKRRFQVVVASGRLSEIKLRCDRRYVSFGFDASLYYRIADQYGDCGLELIGDPGTRFELIQS